MPAQVLTLDDLHAALDRIYREPPVPRVSLTAVEAARSLGVSPRTVYRLVRDGQLPRVPNFSQVLIPLRALHNFVEGRPVSEGAVPSPDGSAAVGEGSGPADSTDLGLSGEVAEPLPLRRGGGRGPTTQQDDDTAA